VAHPQTTDAQEKKKILGVFQQNRNLILLKNPSI
jgi:hypothetical protein